MYMQKRHFLMAVLLILLFGLKTNAQVLTPSNSVKEVSEYHIPTSPNLLTDHSSKIVKWKDKFSVVMNHIVNDNSKQTIFGLLENSNMIIKTVSLPIEYIINDFTILNDTLYFVGNKKVALDTINGIIGYVNIESLFNTFHQECVYAEVRSTYNFIRVEAYNKDDGETVVASTGRQFYGKVYYQEEPDFDIEDPIVPGPTLPLPPNSNIIEPQITGENEVQINSTYDELGMGWITDTQKHRECLATLHIKRTSDSVEHKYDLWHLPFENFQGRIRDICLTDDFISVVTTYFEAELCSAKNNFNVYWFDKNNLENRWAKRLIGQIHYFSDSIIRGELETVYVGGNDIALCYMGNAGENCNILYKLRIDTNTITPLLSHTFAWSGDSIKHPVWDLEYIKRFNMLAVLKRSNIYEGIDEVWHLSMNENTMMPYESYVHTKYYDNLSSLELYDGIYLGIYGNVPTRKILLEKQCNEFNSYGNCYDIRKDKVYSELLPIIDENPLMERCKFIYMDQQVRRVLTLPAYQNVRNFRTQQINQYNIIKPCDNIHTDIIYKQPK